MSALPDKLSDMIRVALKDLADVRANPAYRVNLSTYHTPKYGVCVVCFAGSVMAQTLAASPDKDIFPGDILPRRASSKLYALDAIRCGDIKTALRLWPGAPTIDVSGAPSVEPRIGTALDEEDEYTRFVAEMNTLADWLADRAA